jgi:hypothetical protein
LRFFFKRLNYNWNCAYASEFPVAVEEKLKTITEESIGLYGGHNFCWKAFWDSNPDLSYLRLD